MVKSGPSQNGDSPHSPEERLVAEIAPLRPAATVVVLRPALIHPFEVLLVRRDDAVAFMGGAHVFPGGRVDDGDMAAPAAACDGLTDFSRWPDLAPGDDARHRVAAIRELLEEAGLLLARHGGRMIDAPTAADVRGSLTAGAPFVAALAARGLTVALDAVMPFAHWITPEIEIKRFDTRFLLARVPDGQDATHDAGEMTALEWLAPAEAVARARRGELKLPPPTWSTLARLADFESVDAAWEWAATTTIVPIQPRFLRDGARTVIMLPGDPSYPLPEGCEPIDEVRFELLDGAWRPVPA